MRSAPWASAFSAACMTVSASVRAFLAQRLVRRLCPSCKVPHEYTQEHLDSIGFPKGEEGQMFLANEGGCDRCRNSGYLGRLAIYELCLVTPAIEGLIVSGASSAEIKQKAIEAHRKQLYRSTIKQYF